MASIMFAMFLVLGISLLALGFATLVRNDQRQAIDKTLSNQAQYAAESAINKVQGYLKTPAGLNSENTNCSGGGQTPTFTGNNGIAVTCLTWNSQLDKLYYNDVDISPVATNIDTPSGASNLTISWQPAKDNNATGTYGSNPALLQISANKIPTVRIVFAPAGDVSAARVAYLNPTTAAGIGEIDADGKGSGFIGDAKCSGTPVSCSITIKNTNLTDKGLIALSSLNGKSNIQVQAASIVLTPTPPTITPAPAGLTASYYCGLSQNPASFTPSPKWSYITGAPTTTQRDVNIGFNKSWLPPSVPTGLPGCTAGHYFGVKWIGKFESTIAGSYTFGGWQDDAMRISIGGNVVYDKGLYYSGGNPSPSVGSSVVFGANESKDIEIDYYDTYSVGAEALPRFKGPADTNWRVLDGSVKTGPPISTPNPDTPSIVGQKISNAQAKIDVNAKSQDVSKRLVAYVSLPATTWHPGFVSSGDALCKNYALGINGNALKPPSSANPDCPN